VRRDLARRSECASFCVTGFDDGVNEIASLVTRQERAFHGTNGDFLEVVHRERMKASVAASNSLVTDVLLISRLFVFRLTRNSLDRGP